MTLPETLVMMAGAVISVATSYVPGLRDKFATLRAAEKQLVMLAAMLVVTLGVFVLSCLGLAADLVGMSTTCDQVGALELVRGLILAVVANQATFLISPKRAG